MASESERRPGAASMALVLSALLLVPTVILVAKVPGLPTARFLARHVTLSHVPAALRTTVGYIIFVPLGALVVVFSRLTLGLRVLGPFRSILLAFAFLATGILPGLLFLAVTVTVLVLLRPGLRALRLPYFGRISVMLSAVAVVIVVATMVGVWVGSPALLEVVRFPIVALCLVGEAVARTSRKEGVRSGLWRVTTTAAVAVVVTALASLGTLRDILLRYPELLLVEIALIVVVSTYGAWRLLEGLNGLAEGSASAVTEAPRGPGQGRRAAPA